MKLYSRNQEKTIVFFEKLFPFQVFFESEGIEMKFRKLLKQR